MSKPLRFAFLFLLSIVLDNHKLTAQSPTQSVSGYVFDNTSNEALPGANIVVLGSDPLIGTVTDTKGKFRLESIPVGYVSLRVTFVGYQTVVLSNMELWSGKELVINIFMDDMVITGDEVEIVARVDKSGSINRITTVSARTFTVDDTRRFAGSRNDVVRMASNYAGFNLPLTAGTTLLSGVTRRVVYNGGLKALKYQTPTTLPLSEPPAGR